VAVCTGRVDAVGWARTHARTQIWNAAQEVSWAEEQFSSRIDLITQYIRKHELPPALSERLLEHLYLQNSHMKLTAINNDVSDDLYLQCCKSIGA
jgi:hypothetical protein